MRGSRFSVSVLRPGAAWRVPTVFVAALALLVPTAATAADIATKPIDLFSPRPLEETPSVGGKDAPPVTVVPPAGDRAPLWTTAPPVWPNPVDVQVALAPTNVPATASASSADTSARSAAPATGDQAQAGRVPGAPVWVTPGSTAGTAGASSAARSAAGATTPKAPAAGAVRVQVQDRAATERAGVEGMLLAVRPVDDAARGPVTVGVDYAAIRNAFGGDWASRLRLVALPECALTTPDKPECRVATELPSARNDTAASRLVADVDLGATQPTGTGSDKARAASPSLSGGVMVLAATADASSGSGDYKATSLEATGSWQVSGNSGSFAWTYPIAAPKAITGAAPNVNLAYNSASVDGRTVTKNAQPSWVGDGWDYHPGFIERSFQGCKQDGKDGTGEVCWSGKQQLTMSLNGSNTTLIRNDADGVWRTQDGANTRVELLTGDTANGDNDGEYWKVTTTDGTQYVFGQQSSGAPGAVNSQSTWTRPVYANNAGEPCYNADFAAAWCQQAWRWNLAYVVDVRGSLVSYTWAPETNHYARNPNAATPTGTLTPYTRGGQLAKVTYGSKVTDTTGPTAQLLFGTNERCKDGATCPDGSISTATAANWPDVPYDQNCAATGTCENYAPTFWTTRKLAKITAQVKVGSTMTTVDEWALAHEFVNPGDGTTPSLWLKSITRTGFDGANTFTLPSVDFTGTLMNNRVDAAGDNAPPINRRRVTAITTETGLSVAVVYAPTNCVPGAVPAADTNGKRCFPVWWNYDEIAEPKEHWFHKYVVAEVTESDLGALSPTRSTRYEYVGDAAWHRDDSELTEDKYRTWNEFRGYAEVITRAGVPSTVTKATQTSTVYLRGMDGDRLKNGTPRIVTIPGTTDPDRDVLAGYVRETRTYTEEGGTLVATTVNDPWLGLVTATHVRQPSATLPALTAQKTGTKKTTSTALWSDGVWRGTSKTTTYDETYGVPTNGVPTYGVPLTVLDHADGAPGLPDSDYCITTAYAHNTVANILALPVETTTVTGTCGTDPGTATTVSHSRTLYDTLPFGQIGAVGAATGAQVRQSYTGNDAADWITTTTSYDVYGRTISVTDPLGNTTTTGYEPGTAVLPTKVTVTNAKGWTTVTDRAGGRNLPVRETDANGRVTELAYDVLGRATAVWLPGQARSGPASMTFAYNLAKTAPSTVTTRTLVDPVASGSYLTSIQILDSFLQVRQTQAQDLRGGVGRLITDTVYDSLGRVVLTSGPYFDAENPSTTRNIAEDNKVPGQTGVFYDGMGRKLAETYSSKAQEQWRTTLTYDGVDKVSTTPPDGGTATTVITDARGKTAELRQYRDRTKVGLDDPLLFDRTEYTYDGREQLASVTGPTHPADRPTGDTWSWTYDLLGRQVTSSDPDKGASETHYNPLGQVDWTRDARGQVLWTTYDSLGRKTALYKDSVADANLLSSWSYDRLAKGQADGSTRYVGGKAGAAYTSEVTGLDVGYRPTGTKAVIPSTEGKLAGTYTATTSYDATTGNPIRAEIPAVADLPAETLQYGYDSGGNLKTLSSFGLAGYINWIDYDGYGRHQRTTFGSTPKQVAYTTSYDFGTGRLLSTNLDRQTGPGGQIVGASVDATSYTYKANGDVTSITTRRDDGTVDRQCFTYDYLQRMTQAWTDKGDVQTQPGPSIPGIGGCTNQTPSSATVGGPSPYWQSYLFDPSGNRTQLVDHDPAGNTAKDTTTDYASPAGGQPKPHTVSSSSSRTGATTTQQSYGYDQAGNTTTRPGVQTPGNPGAIPTLPSTLWWETEDTNTANITVTGNRTIDRQANCCGVSWSGGRQVLTGGADGDWVTFEVNVPTAGNYAVQTQQTVAGNFGILQAKVDADANGNGGTALGTFDAYAPAVGITPVTWGTTQLAAGKHKFTFKVTGKNPAAGGHYLGIDTLTLRAGAAFETEQLPRTSTKTTEAQANCCGVVWSSNKQVLSLSTAVGDQTTFTFTAPQDGIYTVGTRQTTASNFGTVQGQIDGKDIGKPFDAYTPGVGVTDVTWSTVALKAGTHTFTQRVTGKNGASAGYAMGTDTLTLTPTWTAEAESLKATGNRPAVAQGNCCGVVWSKDQQLWFQGAADGDNFTLTVNVPADGLYQINTIQTKASNFGQTHLTVDGTSVGGTPFDGYQPSGVSTAPANYGRVRLTAGTHTLTFTVRTSPTAQAAQVPLKYEAGIDTVTLTPLAGPDGTPTRAGDQTLTWDIEGHLASVKTLDTGLIKTSDYLYDADGNRLLRIDPDQVTLYLGATELTLQGARGNTTGTVTGTRYYSGPGGAPTVVRTGGKLYYQAADHHGTSSVSLDAATLAVTRRDAKPYGDTRGPQPNAGAWPDDKGFLGKPQDTTGLTHIGAREYDPGLGRFISVDPIMDLTRSQQMHGYLYAGGNPVTNSDPTGLDYCPSHECNHDDPENLERIRGGKGWGSIVVAEPPAKPVVVFVEDPDEDRRVSCWQTNYGGVCNNAGKDRSLEPRIEPRPQAPDVIEFLKSVGELTFIIPAIECTVTHNDRPCEASGMVYSGGPLGEGALFARFLAKTLKGAQADEIAKILESLPVRAAGDPTVGQVIKIKKDGTVEQIGGAFKSGENAPFVNDIDDYLKTTDGIPYPPAGKHPAISHVETKLAWRMVDKQTKNVDLVINKVEGPCGGDFSCLMVVPKILPKGYTLTVYYRDSSGKMVGIPLKGER